MKNKLFMSGLAVLTALTVAACASMTLVSVETDNVTGPEKVRQGQSINPRDIMIWGEYKDGSRKMVSVSQSNITFDSNRVGRQKVYVRTSVAIVSFETEVMALTGIIITSQPTKTVFRTGEERNSAWPGLAIQAAWNQMGSDTIPVSSCQITGYNKDVAGKQTISVAFSGKTASFSVEVLGLTSIELDKPPDKTDYEVGEQIDLAGIVLYGTFGTNPSTRIRELIPANELTVSGYDPNRVGRQQKVTVTFKGQSVNIFVNVEQGLNGTWVHSDGKTSSDMIYMFNNGNLEYSINSLVLLKGTYSTSGGKTTYTPTHLGSVNLMLFAGLNFLGKDLLPAQNQFTENPEKLWTRNEVAALDLNQEVKDYLVKQYGPTPMTYSISGNTLTLTMGSGKAQTYTRR